jgi:hypothetical protein
MVWEVFVIQPALESEACGWHVGNYPFIVPLWLSRFSDSSCPVGKIRVLLVALWLGTFQSRMEEGVRRDSDKVGGSKVRSAVEDESNRVALRRIGKRSWIETSWRSFCNLVYAIFESSPDLVGGFYRVVSMRSIVSLCAMLLFW